MTSPALDQKALAAALDAVAKLHARMAVERKLPGYCLIIPEAISAFLAALPATEPVATDLQGIVHEAVRNTAARAPSLRGPYVFDEAELQASAASPPSHQGLKEALTEYDRAVSMEGHSHGRSGGVERAANKLAEIARAALQSQPAPSGETNATAARFARLSGIVSRLRWTDLGIPAMEHDGTREALSDLATYLFAEGVDEVMAAKATPSQPPLKEGE